jgi:hypothetical protein
MRAGFYKKLVKSSIASGKRWFQQHGTARKTCGLAADWGQYPNHRRSTIMDFDLEFLLTENAAAIGVDPNVLAIFLAITFIFSLVFTLVYWVCMWLIFEKAGKPGWTTIIPIVNVIMWLRVCGKSGWWLLALLIPGVNVLVALWLWFSMAESFGKGALFGLGLIFFNWLFIFWLAFDESVWLPPDKRKPQAVYADPSGYYQQQATR